MKHSLRTRALRTELYSRFIAREEDLGRKMTDEEVKEEAKFQLENLPYNVRFDDEPELYRKAVRQMKALMK